MCTRRKRGTSTHLDTGRSAYAALTNKVQLHEVTAEVLASCLLDPVWNSC